MGTIYKNGIPYSGGGIVDQTYDATSENAQSGTAVAEAVAGKAELIVTPGDDKVEVLQGSSGFELRADNGGLVFNIGGSDIMTLQPKLESGTNIKTINGASLLGSGDITVGGSSIVPFADKTVTEDTFFGDEGYVGMSLNCSGSWDKTADMSQIGTGAAIHSYDDRYLYGTISFSTGYTFTAQSDGALLRFVRVALNVGAKYGSPAGWQNMLNAKFKQHYPGDGSSEYTQSRTYPAGQGTVYIKITPNGGTAEAFVVPSWVNASVLRRPNDNSDVLIDELVLIAYVNRVFNAGDKIQVLGSSDSIVKIRRDMIDFADGYGPYA